MVSIIIPSYNSQDTIEACLDSLVRQTYPGDYEIILADSSVDKTPQIVGDKFPSVHLIHFDIKTDPGTARNKAIEHSKGDIICCIDSDCIAERDWLKKMVQVHSENIYAAVGGIVYNGNDPSCNTAWAGYLAEFRDVFPNTRNTIVPHIPTCNISYKRYVFEQEESFNSDYYPQEDLEFNHRITNNGHLIYLDASIRVDHFHRTKFNAFIRHQFRFGKITAHILKILPLEGSKLVRNRLYLVATFWLLPMVKWWRTLRVTQQKQPQIILKHPWALVILAIGLIPWAAGFFLNGFFNNLKRKI